LADGGELLVAAAAESSRYGSRGSGSMLQLCKPQFEVGPEHLGKGGDGNHEFLIWTEHEHT